MLKILTADDHRVLREGLKKIIEQTRDMMVSAEASNGAEVLERVSKVSVDVVVLDISMPGQDGLETLKRLKKQHPKLPVLVLSQYSEDHYATRALRAGAAGYITKEAAPNELISALRKVAAGGKYVSPTLAEKLAADISTDLDKPPHETLSDREYEILCMLGTGKTVSEIGNELFLSVKTISTYRTRILDKMRMTKTVELMRYALEHELVPVEPQPKSVKTSTPRRRPARRS